MSRLKRQSSEGMVRIIGGHLRSRRIRFHAINGLRPTPDRVRETLFNWLVSKIAGAACLDLFSGSGALGFEAASRGASTVTLVENNPRAFKCLEANTEMLGLEQVHVYRERAQHFLKRTTNRYDLIFLDPPFDDNSVVPILQIILAQGCLAPGGWVYIEQRATASALQKYSRWEYLRKGRAGDVSYQLVTPVTHEKCDGPT